MVNERKDNILHIRIEKSLKNRLYEERERINSSVSEIVRNSVRKSLAGGY